MDINPIIEHLPDMPAEDVRTLFDAVSAEYQTLPYRDRLQMERARSQVNTIKTLRESGAITTPVASEDGVYKYVSGTVYLPGETVDVDGQHFTLGGHTPTTAAPGDDTAWNPIEED